MAENVDIIVRERGARAVRRSIEDIGRGAGAARGAVQLLRGALGALAVGFGLRAVTSTLANFSQEMSTLRAVTRATESQFQALREETIRLGTSTRFSASEAAQGATFLARAGFDTNEVLTSLEQTLTLAQAGALGLGTAADIASNVLQGFRLNVSETGRVVDVLAFTANNANTNVQQLGDAMSFVAPVAASLGVTLNESAAAVAALSDAGVQGGRAGRNLRAALAALESPSQDAVKVLAELGLTVDDVRVSQVGLFQAFQNLAAAGATTADAFDIFGREAAPVFQILSQAIPTARGLAEELENVDGFAAKTAATMDDNLNGAMLAARSAAEGLVIAFGDLGAEAALQDLFLGLASALRFVADNLENVAEAAAVAGAALALAFRGAIVSQIGAVATALLALNRVLLANPLFALASAVVAATTALVALQDQVVLVEESGVTFGDVWDAALERVGGALSGMVDTANDAFRSVTEAATGTGLSIGEAFLGALNSLVDTADLILGTFEGLWRAITVIFLQLPEFLEQVGLRAVNGLATTLEDGLNIVISGLNALPGIELGLLELGRLETEALGTGASIADAFMDGFRQRPIRGFIQGVLDDATDTATYRRQFAEIAGEFNEFTAGLVAGGVPGSPETPDLPERRESGEGSGVTARDRQALLENELRLLEQEAQMLRLVGDERRVLETQLEVESRIRQELKSANEELSEAELTRLSRLTEAEAGAVEAAVRRNEQIRRETELLRELEQPGRDLQERLQTLNALYEQGTISLQRYNQELIETRLQQAQLRIETGEGSFADGFLTELGRMVDGVASFRAEAGSIIGGFLTDFTSGFANSVGQAIVMSENLTDSLINVAQQGLSQLISGFVELGLQWIINQVLAQTLGAAATATSAAQGAAVASAWAPAAALASLATLGANAGPAIAGITSTLGLTEALAFAGSAFAEGTDFVRGPGTSTSDDVLAALSVGEGVVTAEANRRNPGVVAAMNDGAVLAGPSPSARPSMFAQPGEGGGPAVQMNVSVENYSSAEISVERITETDVRIIAREEARDTVQRDSPKVIAGEIDRPNSRVSQALGRSTSAQRRRT